MKPATSNHQPATINQQPATTDQLKLVIVGHVDHGKSTLVGRLIADTGSLPDGKLAAMKASCEKRGMKFEWSFLMDALQAERDQGITIDTTQVWLKTPQRDIVIIDAPGHREFLKNMVTGAAQADAALILIDAKEGIREQSRRHGYLLHLLGIKQIAVLVNKMDAVEYDESVFRAIEAEYSNYLGQLGMMASCFIPISAREGDNIAPRSPLPNPPPQAGEGINRMHWYHGPTVLEALQRFAPAADEVDKPLRIPLQDVYKFDERRILAGRIESGRLKVGDELLFSPGNMRARVASIESWGAQELPTEAVAGESIGITLDEQIFAERGMVASHISNAPMLLSFFRARIFWLGHKPLVLSKRYKIKLGTAEAVAELRSIERVIATETLAPESAEQVERNQVAEVTFRVRGLIAVDAYETLPRTGRFVILEDYDTVGGGIIDTRGAQDQRTFEPKSRATNITPTDSSITAESRALANGHFGGILWFSGLSGSGKSTLAQALQKHLFARGIQVFVLDGDNVRKGLNRDLGFSLPERHENIRRAAEVAALFAEAGMIVITSFITPTREDRAIARAASPKRWHSVYVEADLATCEARDVKGLYKKARAGEIKDFTGISSPYEAPEDADIVIDTANENIAASVAKLLAYVERHFILPANELSVRDAEGHLRDFAGGEI